MDVQDIAKSAADEATKILVEEATTSEVKEARKLFGKLINPPATRLFQSRQMSRWENPAMKVQLLTTILLYSKCNQWQISWSPSTSGKNLKPSAHLMLGMFPLKI